MATRENGSDFRGLDKFKRAAYSVQILAGNIHGPSFAEANSDKDGVEILFELLEAYVASDFHFLAEFNAQRFHHVHFAQRIGDARFVSRDAVGAQSTGKFSPRSKHRHARSPFAQDAPRTPSDAGPEPMQATRRPFGVPAWNS